MKPIHRSARSGFTLLELIIALGLLAVSLLFISSLLISVTRANRHSLNSTAALQLAQEKIERLKAVPFSSLQGGIEPCLRVGDLPTAFSRETSVNPGIHSSSVELSVKVAWFGPLGRNAHVVELTTLLTENRP